MPWQKFLRQNQDQEQELAFTSLVEKNFADSQQDKLSAFEIDLNFKVLTQAQDKFKLPKHHQDSSILNINYNEYVVLYAGLDNYQRAGYEVKIKRIVQREEEIEVQVVLFSPTCEFALEVINFPYDLVKIYKDNFPETDYLKFKLTAGDQGELLTQKEVELG